MNKKEVLVKKERKLSAVLQDYGFSFSDVNKMLRNKDVRVDGVVQKKDVVVKEGEKVCFFYRDQMLSKKFEIIYEDEEVVIVYKYSGIETDGEKGVESVLKAIAVHRLDRNTEGVLIFAKGEKVAKKLEKAQKNHRIHKFYLAEVVGRFETDKTHNAFLTKDSEKAEVRVFDHPKENSLPIATKIKTLKAKDQSSVLEIELLTGRTHQIRAHLAHLGHPIVGDGKYGDNETNKKFHEKHQKLACFRLIFEEIGIKGIDNKTFEKFPKWYSNNSTTL